METAIAMRDKLFHYISVASKEELETMCTVLKLKGAQPKHWYEDKEFLKELQQRWKRLESGADKGYTLEEVKANLDELRKERYE